MITKLVSSLQNLERGAINEILFPAILHFDSAIRIGKKDLIQYL